MIIGEQNKVTNLRGSSQNLNNVSSRKSEADNINTSHFNTKDF